MASIERTAYPRFKRFMSARELHVFYTPQQDEIVCAREAAGSDEHLLALVVLLKAFNRLGYFPVLDEVPAEVVGHIRRDLRLPEHIAPVYASARTAERHRSLVRARSEAVHDPAGARKVAADAIEEAAPRKNDPADLIKIALERLVEDSYELPAFRTLNDTAITIRGRVNEGIFATVLARLGDAGAARLVQAGSWRARCRRPIGEVTVSAGRRGGRGVLRRQCRTTMLQDQRGSRGGCEQGRGHHPRRVQTVTQPGIDRPVARPGESQRGGGQAEQGRVLIAAARSEETLRRVNGRGRDHRARSRCAGCRGGGKDPARSVPLRRRDPAPLRRRSAGRAGIPSARTHPRCP